MQDCRIVQYSVPHESNPLQQLHLKMAHASPLKRVKILKEDFTITNMYRRVRRLLKTYLPCQTAKAPNLHTYVPMANVITKGKGQMIAIDFLGPLPKACLLYTSS